jgi:hypothetical protein
MTDSFYRLENDVPHASEQQYRCNTGYQHLMLGPKLLAFCKGIDRIQS